MENDIKEVMLTKEKIQNKVIELGKRISKDYLGKDLILIGVLKGSVLFMADLLKEITIPCSMDFMAVSSVLIVEDIIDSGVTLKYLMEYLKGRNPNSVNIACLLNKPDRRKVDIDVSYLGFDIPDYFVVGYGLDYAEKYRNLPYIGILKEEIYK